MVAANKSQRIEKDVNKPCNESGPTKLKQIHLCNIAYGINGENERQKAVKLSDKTWMKIN